MQPTHHPLGRVTTTGPGFFKSFVNAILATAIFRCWHILIFFTAWAAAISVISSKGYKVAVQSTLLTVCVRLGSMPWILFGFTDALDFFYAD